MDVQDNGVSLFCQQTQAIVARIREGSVHRVKTKFIREKYGEVSHIFMTVYGWYKEVSAKIVPRPEGAESGIWAFADLKSLDRYADSAIMELRVPVEQAVFFRLSDWNQILNLRYLPEDEADSRGFAERISRYGVPHESDIMLKSFYPQLKQEVLRSWGRLFRYDAMLRQGAIDFPDVQAGLWEVRPEWVEAWDL